MAEGWSIPALFYGGSPLKGQAAFGSGYGTADTKEAVAATGNIRETTVDDAGLQLGELTLANRIVIAPMCQYSAEDGSATDWHTIHLGSLAQSGAGLLIIEATAVEARGRISWADLGLWSDANEAALAQVLESVRRYSAMPIGIQLAHAGRKASTERPWDGGGVIAPDALNGWQTVSASPLAFRDGDPLPQALTPGEIDEIVEAFVAAALRADRLGLDVIEIHAAHGYLLHQFLSQLSNQRSDDYGGSLENRMRLTLLGTHFDSPDVQAPLGLTRAQDDDDPDGDTIEAEQFEQFLHKKYLGQKRFSLEGGEGLAPPGHRGR